MDKLVMVKAINYTESKTKIMRVNGETYNTVVQLAAETGRPMVQVIAELIAFAAERVKVVCEE